MASLWGLAGVPARLAHPYALRTNWATSLLEDGVPADRRLQVVHEELETESHAAHRRRSPRRTAVTVGTRRPSIGKHAARWRS
jgi:hypothetical protein